VSHQWPRRLCRTTLTSIITSTGPPRSELPRFHHAAQTERARPGPSARCQRAHTRTAGRCRPCCTSWSCSSIEVDQHPSVRDEVRVGPAESSGLRRDRIADELPPSYRRVVLNRRRSEDGNILKLGRAADEVGRFAPSTRNDLQVLECVRQDPRIGSPARTRRIEARREPGPPTPDRTHLARTRQSLGRSVGPAGPRRAQPERGRLEHSRADCRRPQARGHGSRPRPKQARWSKAVPARPGLTPGGAVSGATVRPSRS
jgi:hypothetical protein